MTPYPKLAGWLLTKGGSSQSIPPSTPTDVTWNTADHDPFGAKSGNTVVVPVSGIYIVTHVLEWGSDSGGSYRHTRLWVNAAIVAQEVVRAGNTSDFSAYTPNHWCGPLNKGDVLKIDAVHNRGSATVVTTNSKWEGWMVSKI